MTSLTNHALSLCALSLTLGAFVGPARAQSGSAALDMAGRRHAVVSEGVSYQRVSPDAPREPEALDLARFIPDAPSRFGTTEDAVWFRFDLRLPREQHWVLQLDMPALDEVDVFFERPDGSFETHRAGDRRPLSARDRASPVFAFDIPAREGLTRVLIRVQTEGVFVVPLSVTRLDEFEAQLGRRGAIAGLFFGVLLALALYNLLLFVMVRDPGYGWYGALLLGICLFSAARSGHAALYLWPDSTDFGHRAPTLFGVLSVALAARFVPNILETRRTMPSAHRAFAPMSLLALALVPGVWLFYGWTLRALVAMALVSALALPPMIAVAWRRGSVTARYFGVAHAVMSLGVVLFALRSVGALPSNVWTEHLVTVGACVEALLLSLALADRIRRLSAENTRQQRALVAAKRDALESQRAFTGELLRAQDGERQRIASDLHDGLGQTLLALLTHLRRRQAADPTLGELASAAGESVGELREIARGLHPARLDRLGVADAIRTTATETLGALDLRSEVVVADIDDQLPREHHVHLYRILQESLSNVVRHSGASEVEVTLRAVDTAIVLSIEDDGEGDPRALDEGVGLSSIRARARAIGADLQIREGLGGRGVALRIEVPVER